MHTRDDARLKRIVEALQPYAPEKILLFGSYARGDQDAFSDVDLVIIKETEERFLDRLETVYRYIQPDFALDALVYTPDEFAAMQQEGNSFAEQLDRDSIVLYQSSTGRLRQSPALSGQKGWSTMKQEEEARSWLEQAQADLAVAEWLLQGEHYHATCFWAQQVAEKSLKAFLYLHGERHIIDHSIYRLGKACVKHDPSLAQAMQELGVLDRFYIPTRYPNGLPLGSVPAQVYSLQDAQRALALAKQAVEIVEAYF